MGLMSPGGVHSHQDHIVALARVLPRRACRSTCMPFSTGATRRRKARSVSSSNSWTTSQAAAAFASPPLSGRYYAMDRDKRWDRVAKAYDAIVDAGPRIRRCESGDREILCRRRHRRIRAALRDRRLCRACDGDALLFANFRADRAREISLALLDPASMDLRARAWRISPPPPA